VSCRVSHRFRSSVLRSSLMLGLAKVAAAVGTLIAAPFLLSELGTEVFGIWVVAAAALGYAALADLGIGAGIVLAVSRAHHAGDTAGVTAFLLRGASFYLAVGLALLGSAVAGGKSLAALLGIPTDLRPFSRDLLIAFVIAWILQRLSHTGGSALDADGRFTRSQALPALLAAGLWPLAAVVVAITGDHRSLLFAAVIPSAASLLLVGGPVLFRALKRSGTRRLTRRASLRPLIRYSGTVQVAAVADVINYSTDRLIVAGLVSLAAVAPFELGARLATAVTVLAVSPLSVMFPWLVSMTAQQRRLQTFRLGLVFTAFGALIAANVGAVAPSLVPLWLRRPDDEVVWVAVVLVIGFAVHASSGPYTTEMKAEGAFGPAMRFAIVAAALNVGITIPAALTLGLRGVVVGTVVSLTISTFVFLGWTVRRQGYGWGPVLILCYSSLAALGAALAGRTAITSVGGALASVAVGVATTTLSFAALIAPFMWKAWGDPASPLPPEQREDVHGKR
jgi:O-antigen/teichoic acid export membrane protein